MKTIDELMAFLMERKKRSKFPWSAIDYNYQDWKNEGQIEAYQEILDWLSEGDA